VVVEVAARQKPWCPAAAALIMRVYIGFVNPPEFFVALLGIRSVLMPMGCAVENAACCIATFTQGSNCGTTISRLAEFATGLPVSTFRAINLADLAARVVAETRTRHDAATWLAKYASVSRSGVG
jgi:hypothetical protein